jgi:hypothetical protein
MKITRLSSLTALGVIAGAMLIGLRADETGPIAGYLGAVLDGEEPSGSVRVQAVRAGAPAELGGLQAGDLITTIDSEAINGFEHFDAILSKTSPGQQLSFVVDRNGEPQTANVTLGRRPTAAVPLGANQLIQTPLYAAVVAKEDPLDEESQKLFDAEKTAAADANKILSELKKARSEAPRAEMRSQLREKLAKVFDLQQQRRAHEIAKIEERLGKLKETMKRRDAAKDSIVDRRLEVVTGGTDELGWEETGSRHAPYAIRSAYPQLAPHPAATVVVPPARTRPTTGKTPATAWPAPAPSPQPEPPSQPNAVPPAAPAAPAPAATPAPAGPAASPAPAAPPALPAPVTPPAAAAPSATPAPPVPPPAVPFAPRQP